MGGVLALNDPCALTRVSHCTLVSARLRIFPVKRRTRGTSSPVPMPKNVSFHGRSRNQGLPNVARHVCQNDARYFT